jgi:predicted dehydrogenase/threonine dehydrogenase-like Zn-dependent dehydrogenase
MSMKQLAQYQDGRLELQEVPSPVAPPGGILVRVTHSVISPGTEKMKVEQARMSLLQKARARPDQVRKVLDTARTLGWKSAIEKVRNRLESPSPLGYSAAGIVEAVDVLNPRFCVGDRVACGGAECAHHAEFIAVPDLLASPIPEGVEDWQAAYTTLASISMEGVRQTDASLGERVLIMGQGLVGLLATNLMTAAGVRVMAVDFSQERLAKATALGAERVINPSVSDVAQEVRTWTQGQGVDSVMLCVGGKGRDAADTAIECLRDRGVMVIVGIYDAELSWKTAYMKDIQVRYSRSYGPGRYDPNYEWGGHDYPLGHVRWTENRNFESCLHLMKTGALKLDLLTTRRAAFSDAISVYNALMTQGNNDIGVVLDYPSSIAVPAVACDTGVSPGLVSKGGTPKLHPSSIAVPAVSGDTGVSPGLVTKGETPFAPVSGGTPKLHVVGAGNFARTMLLPHLKGKIALGTVVNATGLSARHVKEKFGFESAETDSARVLSERGASIMIGTRHHLHAPMVLEALQNDQHVFVEKPLCLSSTELSAITEGVSMSKGSVMVGFNRRFAPATVEMKRHIEHSSAPVTISYHVNAGLLASDHWYARLEESGGRLLGEGCHMFDLACYLIQAKPLRVTTHSLTTGQTVGGLSDSFTSQVVFSNGSVFQLIYSSEGDSSFPKETLTAFAPGLVLECDNFLKLTKHQKRRSSSTSYSSKGHAEEMAAWLKFLHGKQSHPMSFSSIQTSMKLTFAALKSIQQARTVEL